MSCSVGGRCSSDPALLQVWCRLAAVAPIRPLAWKPSYAVGAAQEKKRKKKKKKRKEKKEIKTSILKHIISIPQNLPV